MGRIAAIGAQHQRDRVVEARGHDRRSSSRSCHRSRSGSRSGIPTMNRGFGVQVMPIRRSLCRLRRRSHGRHPDDGGRLRVVDHVRESRQPDAGARRLTATRARRPRGNGRRPRPSVWASLSESVLLAVPGTLIGLIASQWAIDWMVSSFPEDHCRTGSTLASTGEWSCSRSRSRSSPRSWSACYRRFAHGRPDLVNDLKEAGRGVSLGRGGQRLQATLAVSQVALCFATAGRRQPDGAEFPGDAADRPRLRSPADPLGARVSGRRCLRRHRSARRVLPTTSSTRCRRRQERSRRR